MPHAHIHNDIETKKTTLLIVIGLNILITATEIIGGILSNSLSLVSDAIHNFSDALSVIIAWIAIYFQQKPPDKRYTFGYKRAQIIAASINAGTLVAISIYLIIEAISHILHPESISGRLMSIVAVVGLIANVLGTYLLHKGATHDTNIKAVYLHLLSDALSSLGVVIGGLAIYYFGINWLDPVITIAISIYILKESLEILKRELDLSMLAAPSDLSLDEIIHTINNIPGVVDVHHVHLWEVCDNDIHLETHIKIKDLQEADRLRTSIEKVLLERFNIHHTTIQIESQDSTCNQPDYL